MGLFIHQIVGDFSYYKKLWNPCIRLSIPITMRSLKWIDQGVLNFQRDILKLAYIDKRMQIRFYAPSLRRDVLWYINVRLYVCLSVRLSVRQSIPITLWNMKWIGQGVLKLDRDMWNGRTDGRTDGQTDGQTDRRTVGHWCFLVKLQFFIPELWDFIHQIVGDVSYVAL
jgi:uncharacterized membrane protein YccF (DUF307 family)